MASQILMGYLTGQNLYAIVQRVSDGHYWRTTTGAFGAYNAAAWSDYDTPLVENGASGTYQAPFPAGITTAGLYRVELRLRAGGSPAVSDPILVDEQWDWSGTGKQSIADIEVDVSFPGSSGAIEFTYTVFKPDGITPLSGCAVYVSTDEAGASRSETKFTDELGQVTFQLDPGNAWFWRSHSSYSFADNPDLENVS